MKLSVYAKKLGIEYRTAWNMFKNKQIPNAYQLPTGTVIVPDEIKTNQYPEQVLLYARVSSPQQKDDLNRQADRLQNYAIAKGYKIYKVYKEVASGLNDNRKLNEYLIDKNYNKIVVEHKDRLTRFGFNYIKLLFDEQNREIEIINYESTDKQVDLMSDFISVITSFCARIYGQRRTKKQTQRLIDNLK